MKKFIISLLALLLAPAFLSAQALVQKVFDELAESNKTINEYYKEFRDPKTRVVTESERMFFFKDGKFSNRLIEAFKKDCQNAIEYQMNQAGNSFIYKISFQGEPGGMIQTITYTLTKADGKYALKRDVHTKKSNVGSRKKSSSSKHASSRQYVDEKGHTFIEEVTETVTDDGRTIRTVKTRQLRN
ncbi:MAG: DUF5024 domain-containing protein [Muribaculaceae bacterium]|nr:DUF5024 domain-containing protein [Muribaculaceae bacterium]